MANYSPDRDALASLATKTHLGEPQRFDPTTVRKFNNRRPIFLNGTASINAIEKAGRATVAIYSELPPEVSPEDKEDILHKPCDVAVLIREPQTEAERTEAARLAKARGIVRGVAHARAFERLILTDEDQTVAQRTGQSVVYIPLR